MSGIPFERMLLCGVSEGSRMSTSKVLLALLLFGSTGLSVWAETGSFSTSERYKPGACGSSRAFGVPITLSLTGNTWSALRTGKSYAGGTLATSGRNINLTLDEDGLALLTAVLSEQATVLCDSPDPVTVSVSVTKATIRLNKRATAASLQITATTGGGPGDGRYSLKGSGSWTRSGSPNTPSPAEEVAVHGRYVGTVTIDAVNFGDALLAANGETHLYIGGPYDAGGAIQVSASEGSIDFVSPATTPSGGTTSGGVIGREGEDCGQPGSPSSRWCGRASSAQLAVRRAEDNESGAIQGTIAGHGETWTFDLQPWSNYYNLPARLSDLEGRYTELVAPFARGGMPVTIDANGRASFGAPGLCSGSGTFTPQGTGRFNVFEVTMSIVGCDYPYSQYNGDYRGLATLSPSDYWAYDSNLRVWLRSFSPDWSAVTMWGRATD